MTTHSSITAWRIPWTDEPGRLQSELTESFTRLSMQAYTLLELDFVEWQNSEVKQFFFCFLREATTSLKGICHNSAIGHFRHQNRFSEIGNIGVYTKINVHLQDNHQTYLG